MNRCEERGFLFVSYAEQKKNNNAQFNYNYSTLIVFHVFLIMTLNNLVWRGLCPRPTPRRSAPHRRWFLGHMVYLRKTERFEGNENVKVYDGRLSRVTSMSAG